MLAITVTISIEVVSELLIVSLVIAGPLNRTPESMVLAATVINSISTFVSLYIRHASKTANCQRHLRNHCCTQHYK